MSISKVCAICGRPYMARYTVAFDGQQKTVSLCARHAAPLAQILALPDTRTRVHSTGVQFEQLKPSVALLARQVSGKPPARKPAGGTARNGPSRTQGTDTGRRTPRG